MHGKAVRLIVLGGLLIALAIVVAVQWRSSTVTPSPAGPRGASRPRVGTTGSTAGGGEEAPIVKLQALRSQRSQPAASQRDLFRLQMVAPSPPPKPLPGTSAGAQPGPAGDAFQPPPPPPPPPLISLKFIGVLEGGGRTGRIAVLSDGRDVFYGRDGDVIDGRYRIIRIGIESIELSYVDGRGRQTIRLTGS